MLGIDDNTILGLMPDTQVTLEFNGCLTFWKTYEGPNNSIWLMVDGRDACINRKKSYEITRLRDNTLFLVML